jgi:hypothetical protein
MRSVKANTKVQAIDTCLMPYKGIISVSLLVSDGPDFDSFVQRSTGKHRWVLRIDGDLHDVVIMVLVRVYLLPAFIPVEQFDGLVVRTTEQVRQLWVHCKVSDEISVFIYHFELLTSVVVVNSDLRVISAYHYPLLPCHEFSASHWSVRHFKGSDLGLLVVIEDGDIACVECNKNPWKGRMELNGLDSL